MRNYLLGMAFKRNNRCTSFIVAGLVLGFAAAAQAQPRVIYVNGERLDRTGIAYVDRLNCGEPVPSGNYWLDLRRGEWGYVGVPGRNPLPDCRHPSPQAKSDPCDHHRYVEDKMHCRMLRMME